MSPSGDHLHAGAGRGRHGIDSRLARQSGDQHQTIRIRYADCMLETAFTRPLSDAAGQIHTAATNLPTFVFQLDDRADGPTAQDPPVALGDIADANYLAVHQRGDRSDADGIADIVNVASVGGLEMVDVFRSAE